MLSSRELVRTLSTLNPHSAVCQLHLNQTERKKAGRFPGLATALEPVYWLPGGSIQLREPVLHTDSRRKAKDLPEKRSFYDDLEEGPGLSHSWEQNSRLWSRETHTPVLTLALCTTKK